MATARRDYISEITPAKESWDVVVRVIRSWFVTDMNSKPKCYAVEMVLMDENSSNNPFQSEIADGVFWDLSSNSDNVGAEEKCEGKGSMSTHIEVDSVDDTPVKRGIVHVFGDIDGVSIRILKNIKIEND